MTKGMTYIHDDKMTLQYPPPSGEAMRSECVGAKSVEWQGKWLY